MKIFEDSPAVEVTIDDALEGDVLGGSLNVQFFDGFMVFGVNRIAYKIDVKTGECESIKMQAQTFKFRRMGLCKVQEF